jgi:hypothetical protein
MTWITAASGIIAVLAFTDSILTRYVRAKSRRYAAEHDFDIVRRELEVLKQVQEKIETDVQSLERSVAVIEVLLRVRGSAVTKNEVTES